MSEVALKCEYIHAHARAHAHTQAQAHTHSPLYISRNHAPESPKGTLKATNSQAPLMK